MSGNFPFACFFVHFQKNASGFSLGYNYFVFCIYIKIKFENNIAQEMSNN